jgi:apolipoprotein N-acyltransferase
LLFAALPPLGLWPLAWLAPIFWIRIIERSSIDGRHPYRALWWAGFGFWLAALHWLCLPHPATTLGLLAIAAYLGIYLPLFVALSRVAVHQLRWPAMVAVPIVWTGLDMASVAHSQIHWHRLIQVADLAGGYGVSFLVMFGAAAISAALPARGRPPRLRMLAIPAIVLLAVLCYGSWRLEPGQRRPGPTIALIQGSIDTYVKTDPGEATTVFQQYFGLSQAACQERPHADLVVWPETMLREPYLTYTADVQAPAGAEWDVDRLKSAAEQSRTFMLQMSRSLGVPLLLGVDTIHYGRQTCERYNSALYVSPQGQLGPRYDKVHPVLFGEYMPLAKTFPWIYRLTPLQAGIESGTSAPVFSAGSARIAANICYESVLSHVIRDQVVTQRTRGEEPDILVNLTNDGWFRGSSELDLHLACGVFRAIECRKPFLVAANTGFSAWIDAGGRIVKQAGRRTTGWIIADVELDDRRSPYLAYGDLPAGLCLLGCLGFAAIGMKSRYWHPGGQFTANAA